MVAIDLIIVILVCNKPVVNGLMIHAKLNRIMRNWG